MSQAVKTRSSFLRRQATGFTGWFIPERMAAFPNKPAVLCLPSIGRSQPQTNYDRCGTDLKLYAPTKAPSVPGEFALAQRLGLRTLSGDCASYLPEPCQRKIKPASRRNIAATDRITHSPLRSAQDRFNHYPMRPRRLRSSVLPVFQCALANTDLLGELPLAHLLHISRIHQRGRKGLAVKFHGWRITPYGPDHQMTKWVQKRPLPPPFAMSSQVRA